MIVLVARRVPLQPTPAYRVAFVPELEGELFGLDEMDEVVQELEIRLALHLEDIPGKRVEKVEGDDDLRKYRPSAANDLRFFFATIEEHNLRVVSPASTTTARRTSGPLPSGSVGSSNRSGDAWAPACVLLAPARVGARDGCIQLLP